MNSRLTKLSKKQIYWILQITGWSGMAMIAVLNNVMVMGSSFFGQLLVQFVAAFFALLFSHFYKILVLKPHVFQKSYFKIVSHAIMAILIICIAMALTTNLLLFFEAPEYFTWLAYIVHIFNFGIFVAPWVILYFIFKLYEKNKRDLEQKLKLEILAKVSELELLKSQLNPHFLFNALNSIKALIQFKSDLAAEALLKLSELLQFSLTYQKSSTISIKQEIEEVEKYLDLEKIRFGDRLNFEFEISKEAYDGQIPPAIILTLAENAIKHGITQLEDGGSIHLKSYVENKWISIIMHNSGHLKLQKINGLGLINIEKRLQNLIGPNATFKIRQKEENTVEAILQYPLNFQSKEYKAGIKNTQEKKTLQLT